MAAWCKSLTLHHLLPELALAAVQAQDLAQDLAQGQALEDRCSNQVGMDCFRQDRTASTRA